MHPLLTNLSQQLATLDLFLAKYRVNEVFCMPSLNPDSKVPSVIFHFGLQRDWIVSAFGTGGWETDFESEGWQHIFKVAMGVRVCVRKAYPTVPYCTHPMPVPPSLLTGEASAVEVA